MLPDHIGTEDVKGPSPRRSLIDVKRRTESRSEEKDWNEEARSVEQAGHNRGRVLDGELGRRIARVTEHCIENKYQCLSHRTNGRGVRTDDDVVIASRSIHWNGNVDRTIYEREARSKGLGFNRGLIQFATKPCTKKTLTNIQMLILRRRVDPAKQDRAR